MSNMGFLPSVEMTFWSCATLSNGRKIIERLPRLWGDIPRSTCILKLYMGFLSKFIPIAGVEMTFWSCATLSNGKPRWNMSDIKGANVTLLKYSKDNSGQIIFLQLDLILFAIN